jgi:hypothetical protein
MSVTPLDVLVRTNFNILTCVAEQKKSGFSLSACDELEDVPYAVKLALCCYIEGFLKQFNLTVKERFQGSDPCHIFAIYRMSKNQYVFSFRTTNPHGRTGCGWPDCEKCATKVDSPAAPSST